MDKPTDLEVKYQKLATEYSKVRSQATVLKKAVLDEQAKSQELRDVIKTHEQKIRKHDQEMESLTFRNEQLTKRIGVLQQELQLNHSQTKKWKGKSTTENIVQSDNSVLDEELHKKILENAQLVSSMADKDFELGDLKERILWLEKRLDSQQRDFQERESKLLKEISNSKRTNLEIAQKLNETNHAQQDVGLDSKSNEESNFWKAECERWKSECEFLRSKPDTDEELARYYETQIREFMNVSEQAKSKARSYLAENQALYARLEFLVIEKQGLEDNLEQKTEELVTTNENYKGQLDAMTEHLAAQNDKITKQCDEIQALNHKLSTKK